MSMANAGEILALIESAWMGLRVLVVGDVMLDQYVWGEVERISPEAPVPVVRATLREEKPGGAANVAMNLAGLGACVTLAGFAGADREQTLLETLLTQDGVEPRLIGVPDIPTTTKMRILSGHQQIMRLDSEAGRRYSQANYDALLREVSDALPEVSVVVLSDYAKGVFSEDFCQEIIGGAGKRGIAVLIDPKCRSFARYRGAGTICPNLKELAAATTENAADLEGVLSAGQALVRELRARQIVVTLGEKGMVILRSDSRCYAPAIARQVYDVSGAGDTVIAVLAMAMASGIAIESAVELANMAAGVVVGKVGTVPIQREELLGILGRQAGRSIDEKVLPLERVLSRVATWRNGGQQIVFTNGCFDILHVGHIRLLEEARRKGDRLVVGVNSDDSVRRLKGTSRPIVGQEERARILAALSAVDAVVIFEESTPLRVIQTIRPDVLVKGGDYREENIVGAREVRARGGRVEIIPLVEGVSTTRLIGRSTAERLREGDACLA